MTNKIYKLRYLPLFYDDLERTVDYISNTLKNTSAALRLVDKIEAAILKRSYDPEAFEPYHSLKQREFPYYRIYVNNYIIYYIVIDDVMEVHRLLYRARDIDRYI